MQPLRRQLTEVRPGHSRFTRIRACTIIAAGCALCAIAHTPQASAAAPAAAPALAPSDGTSASEIAGPRAPGQPDGRGRTTNVESGAFGPHAPPLVSVVTAARANPVVPLLLGAVIGFLAVSVFTLIRRRRETPPSGAPPAPIVRPAPVSAGRELEAEPQPAGSERPAAIAVPGPAELPTRRPEPTASAAPAGDEHCRIEWCPDASGPHFRAVGTNRAGRRYVAGRSPTVSDSRPPLRAPETIAAYEALVERLRKRGWSPEPPRPVNGAPWYAQSFQRRRPRQEGAAQRAARR